MTVRINLIQLKLIFLFKNKNYYHIHVNNASEIIKCTGFSKKKLLTGFSKKKKKLFM